MPKKSRKQRKPLEFGIVDDYKQGLDLSANNSSSIIPVNDDEHQSSSQQLSPNPSPIQPSIIKVRAPKTLNFQQEQQQSEEKKQSSVKREYRDHISTIPEEEREEDNNEKKETVTTNNQSGRLQFKEGRYKSQELEQKMQTEHYSYQGESEEEEQQIVQQGEGEEGQENQFKESQKRMVQVQRKFVAESLEDLVFAQIPSNCTVTCAVTFNHQFLSMTRKYNLYLVKEKKYLFSAEKSRLKLNSEFSFIKSGKKTGEPLGHLKSNFTGLQYVLTRIHSNEGNRVSEQCWIGYDFNMLGLAPQRNITVLKNLNTKLEKIPFFSQIKNYYQNGVTSKFTKFISKKAIQNKKGQLELDFHGKVSGPSSKNFIMTDEKDRESILFGKRKDNTFILQIGHPFSIFQGFAIAISSLDHKLCVR